MPGTPVDIATGITLVAATSGFTAELKDVNPSGPSREAHDVSHQGTPQAGATEFGSKTSRRIHRFHPFKKTVSGLCKDIIPLFTG